MSSNTALRNYPDEVLRLIGEIVVTWSRIELMLKRSFEGLGRFDAYRARLLLLGMNMERTIQMCRHFVVGLDDASAREAIETWLSEAHAVKKLRNDLIHSHWVLSTESDGTPVVATVETKVKTKDGEADDTATRVHVETLEALARRIQNLTIDWMKLAPVARPGVATLGEIDSQT